MNTVWDMLPFKEMVEVKTNGSRQIIDPTISEVEGMENHYKLLFYANAKVQMKIEIQIDKETGFIEMLTVLFKKSKGKPQYTSYKREDGYEAWHSVCVWVYSILHKEFLL